MKIIKVKDLRNGWATHYDVSDNPNYRANALIKYTTECPFTWNLNTKYVMDNQECFKEALKEFYAESK